MKGSKLLKWLIVVGIGIRVILWCFQTSPQGDDGMRYLNESINLIEHGVFSTAGIGDMPTPSAHDMPLWPGIMATIYWITDSVRVTQYVAGAFNILLAFCSTLLLVSMLREKPFFFSEKQIVISVSVLLFMPESIVYSLFHMPDQLAVFLIILGLWCYFRTVSSGLCYMVLSACSFVLAIYAKPICIPLALSLFTASPLVMRCDRVKRICIAGLCFMILGIGLMPWVARNKLAFGTAGITSISGTNLYGCNWVRLVEQLPDYQRQAEKAEMRAFELRIKDFDLMMRSRQLGDYAKSKLLKYFPQYVIFTCKTHLRLYVGTGSVAMLRYLGLERICNALDTLWGSGTSRGYVLIPDTPYTVCEKLMGAGLQILSWLVLLSGYMFIVRGIVSGAMKLYCQSANRCQSVNRISIVPFLCPILCLLLLAVVIGPITATRYRFIMIPFFAMLAGYAMAGRNYNAS